MSAVVRIKDFRRRAPYLHFTRVELNHLLALYASRVRRSEWRDYAINHSADAASFMVFASSRELPQFVILKQANTKGAGQTYAVMNRGVKLAQSRDLEKALAIFDRPIKLVSG